MKVAEKHANQRFGGMSTMTFTDGARCLHRNGWYVTVNFWIFRKRIFVCSDCGHHHSTVLRFKWTATATLKEPQQ